MLPVGRPAEKKPVQRITLIKPVVVKKVGKNKANLNRISPPYSQPFYLPRVLQLGGKLLHPSIYFPLLFNKLGDLIDGIKYS